MRNSEVQIDDFTRQVELICPTCGCAQFSHETLSAGQEYNDGSQFTCAHCGRTFTRKELIEANTESINARIEDMGVEITAVLASELKKQFKKSGWDVR